MVKVSISFIFFIAAPFAFLYLAIASYHGHLAAGLSGPSMTATAAILAAVSPIAGFMEIRDERKEKRSPR